MPLGIIQVREHRCRLSFNNEFSSSAAADISHGIRIRFESRQLAKRSSSRAHGSATDVTSNVSNISVT